MNCSIRKALTLGIILGILTGCAAMRVDIDVYKGPLADEEHIQMQRLAVMAIGAKPLLIQARDILASKEYICQLKKNGKYKEKYISDDFLRNGIALDNGEGIICEEDITFTSRAFEANQEAIEKRLKNARLINSALFLYDDNVSGELKNLIIEGRKALNQFTVSWKSFTNYRSVLNKHLNSYKLTTTSENDKNILDSYISLSSDTWYGASFISKDGKYIQGIDNVFLFLSKKPAVLKEHAELLFDQNSEVFIEDILKLSRSYITAWTALRKLLRTTLLGLIAMDKDRSPSSLMSKQRRDAAINLIATISQWTTAIEALNKCKSNCKPSKESVKQFLYQDPAGAASILLTSDAYLSDGKKGSFPCENENSNSCCSCVEKPCPDNNCKNTYNNLSHFCTSKNNCTETRGSRTFGLVFIPKEGGLNGFTKGVSELASELQTLFNSLSGSVAGFERGRLPEGLETLIENYLDDHSSGKSKSAVDSKEKLIDALVRFSQKLLFVSQNSAYLDVNNDKHDSDEKQIENVFGIIEVVGNSILVQANELIARKNHKIRMATKYQSTVASINSEFSSDKHNLMTRILSSIDAKVNQVASKQKELSEIQKKKNNVNKALSQLNIIKGNLNNENERRLSLKNFVTLDAMLAIDSIKQCETSADKKAVKPKDECIGTRKTAFEGYKECVFETLLDSSDKDKRKKLILFNKETTDNTKKGFCSVKAFKKFILKNRKDLIISIDDKIDDKKLKEKIASNKVDISSKESELRTIENDIISLTKTNERLKKYNEKAVMMINKQAGNVLSKIKAHHISGNVLMDKLIMEIDGLADSEDKKNALTILKETIVPQTIPIDLLTKNKNHDARVAMDALTTWLETYRVKILHDQDENSPAFQAATAALDEAYRDRSGLNYIRPTSSYLRSSYTSTAVQQSNHLEWDNMIADSYKRSIPLISENIVNKNIHKSLNKIDKQFWQNINTVRVSGGGRSNYVLAKDDVGNWGVRAYSSSYKETVDALKDMALFNYSEKTNTQLFDNAKDKNKSNSVGLFGIFTNYKKVFEETRKSTYETFNTKLTSSNLAAQIKTKWDENSSVSVDGNDERLNNAKTLVDEKYNAILKDQVAKLSNEEAIKGSDLIYDLLRAIRRFKAAVNDNLNGKFVDSTPQDGQQAIAEAAKGEVNAIIDPIIKDITKARAQAVANYERALLFIGEATNGSNTTEASTQE